MVADSLLTPFRRDLLFVLVAVGLFAAPLWAPQLPVGEPAYQYERAEVTATADEQAIRYAGDKPPLGLPPISDEIACSSPEEVRACAFERLLISNRTVPTRISATNPGRTLHYLGGEERRYRFVRVNGAIYEPTYVANDSAEPEDGMHRVDLSLDQTAPDEALRFVSHPVTSDDLPRTVAEAARGGDAGSHREVDVPETPIRLEDGTYYRVYLAEQNESSLASRSVELLKYLGPLVGLWLVVRLSRRIEVTYVGDDGRH